ncbi:MAG: hypothetical protein JWR44_3503 [Hymenobacter sp.]|jgi:hypothetical protein|nr:hypothetical protein [Hymenobacter sp.]
MPATSTTISFRRCFLALYVALVLGNSTLLQAQSLPGSGNSLAFNGYSSFVNCGTSNRGISQRVTAEAWIRTTSSAYQFIASKYFNSLSEEKGFILYISGGTAGFAGRIGAGIFMNSGQSTTRIDDGRWHHLTGVCNVSTWQIYVDGTLENAVSYGLLQADLTTSTPMILGSYYVQSGQYFDGEMDEVRLWRTARSQTEIRDNMCRKFATVPPELVAYYRLDQSNGLTAFDEGTMPGNGALMNMSSAWQLSGAPLGDASIARYQTTWPAGNPMRIGTASGDSAIIIGVAGPVRGVHLYAVNSPPSLVPPGPVASTYVGVFTTCGPTSATGVYSLWLRPAAGPSCRNAYVRQGNEYAWTLQPQLQSTPTLLFVGNVLYRSEHILTSGTALTASIAGDSVVCAGGTTQLTAVVGSGSTVVWNTGTTTPTLPNVGPGTYTLTVTSNAGCTRVLRRTVRTVATPNLTITGDSVLCPGATTLLTASAAGASAYRWSTGATTPTLPVTQPGQYTVVATYGAGCTTQARRTVRPVLSGAAPAAFTLGADTTICEGDQLLLQGPAGQNLSYQWSDGSTNRFLMVQTAGRYTLKVLAACGQQGAARTVLVRSCVRVPNIITPNADAHNDRFAVEGLKGEGWALDVYNRWGRTVFRTANYHNDWGPEAAPGLYYVLLRRPATAFLYKGWLEVLR